MDKLWCLWTNYGFTLQWHYSLLQYFYINLLLLNFSIFVKERFQPLIYYISYIENGIFGKYFLIRK